MHFLPLKKVDGSGVLEAISGGTDKFNNPNRKERTNEQD
jgi:hypothetical protein